MPRGVGEGAVSIVYPPGCREVKEDLSPDELIRRLKVSTYPQGLSWTQYNTSITEELSYSRVYEDWPLSSTWSASGD